jgi:hypothetical protein
MIEHTRRVAIYNYVHAAMIKLGYIHAAEELNLGYCNEGIFKQWRNYMHSLDNSKAM